MATWIEGDCTKEMGQIPSGSIDAVFTSPPYCQAGESIDGYHDFIDEVFEALTHPCSDDSIVFMVMGDNFPEVTWHIPSIARRSDWLMIGYDVRDYTEGVDYVMAFKKTACQSLWSVMPDWADGKPFPSRRKPSLVRFPQVRIPGASFPTFSQEMIGYYFSPVVHKGNIVLDPFAGVGSVGVWAEDNDCSAILIEKDPAQVRLGKELYECPGA